MDIADDASDELKMLAAKRQAERDEAARLKAEKERRRVEVVVPHEEAWSVLEDLSNFEADEVVSTLERLAETGRRAGTSAWLQWLPECAAAQKDVLMKAIAVAIRATVGDGKCRPADAMALVSILGGECVADKVVALRESGEDYERGRVLAAAREMYQRHAFGDISPEVQKVHMLEALRREWRGSIAVNLPPGGLPSNGTSGGLDSGRSAGLGYVPKSSPPPPEKKPRRKGGRPRDPLIPRCGAAWGDYNNFVGPGRRALVDDAFETWLQSSDYADLLNEHGLSIQQIHNKAKRDSSHKPPRQWFSNPTLENI